MPSSPPSPPVSKSAIGRNPTVSASEPLLSGDRLAESIALALKSLLSPASSVKPNGRPASPASRADLPCVSLRSGLGLRAGRRSQEEVAAGRILVSRFDRGDSPDSRKKLRDRVCVQLPHILTSPDYSSLLSSDSASDLGSSAIDTQTAMSAPVLATVRRRRSIIITS